MINNRVILIIVIKLFKFIGYLNKIFIDICLVEILLPISTARSFVVSGADT